MSDHNQCRAVTQSHLDEIAALKAKLEAANEEDAANIKRIEELVKQVDAAEARLAEEQSEAYRQRRVHGEQINEAIKMREAAESECARLREALQSISADAAEVLGCRPEDRWVRAIKERCDAALQSTPTPSLRDEAKADILDESREELAALCHEQWSGWMDYLFGKCCRTRDGALVIPKDFAERWQRQKATKYEFLPEGEQNSDRKEADRIIDLLKAAAKRQEGKP